MCVCTSYLISNLINSFLEFLQQLRNREKKSLSPNRALKQTLLFSLFNHRLNNIAKNKLTFSQS